MGWVDRQIRKRRKHDQDVFEESIFNMAATLLGRREADAAKDTRIITKEEIDEVLKYYHLPASDIPPQIRDPEEQLEYCLRPHGVMHRKVELGKRWYKDAYGPVITTWKEDGRPETLLPGSVSGYYYRQPNSGKKIRVNSRTVKQFSEEATCFYRPLPHKKLGVPDLLIFIQRCRNWSDVAVVLLLLALATLVGLLAPLITRFLTGFVLDSGSLSMLASTAVFMIFALLTSQLLTISKDLGLSRIEMKIRISLEAAVMMRIINLPASFFKDYSAGELAERSLQINRLSTLLVDQVVSLGISALMSLMYLIQCFSFSPALTRPAVFILLGTIAVSAAAAALQARVSKRVMESNSQASGIALALINGIQKIKLAGAEKRAFAEWGDSYAATVDRKYNIPFFLKINTALTTAVTLAGTIWLYISAVRAGVESSTYIAFNASFGCAAGAFTALAGVAVSMADIRPILEITKPILETVPEMTDSKTVVTSLNGDIEFANVYFRYHESMPYVINGLNLKIREGEYVAVVGASGCGKSTMVRLLLGFEKPERGAIYYDGINMSRLDVRSLRRRIGSVTQDGSLFPADIYSNIVISAPQLSQNEAWEAAEIAGIADDIRRMPMQMHTMISEGQGGISGGQKQRLMIARAIAPKPKILIFDEATSALDNKTQKQVSDALEKMNCTRIVIAHRLSTIRNCDRILMLERGNIVEEGTYDELIAMRGRFAELVERQQLTDPPGKKDLPETTPT